MRLAAPLTDFLDRTSASRKPLLRLNYLAGRPVLFCVHIVEGIKKYRNDCSCE